MEDAALKMVSIHMGLVMDTPDLLAEWETRTVTRRPATAEM